MKNLLLLLLLPLFSNGQRTFFEATQSDDDYHAKVNIIDAGSVTDRVYRDAVIVLAKDLKVYGVWNLGKAVYPVCGGTSTAHALNLISNTYNLTFNNGSGGWTHNSTGMQGSGTAHALTGFVPSTVCTDSLISLGIYVRTNSQGTLADMGATTAENVPNKQASIWSYFVGNIYAEANDSTIDAHVATSSSLGWTFVTKITNSGSNNEYIQRNSTQTLFTNKGHPPNYEIAINGRNNAGTIQYQPNRQYAGVWIGNKGVTQAQGTAIFNCWNTYETKLSRNN